MKTVDIQSDDFARMTALLQQHGIDFISRACAAAESGVQQTVPIRTVAELLSLVDAHAIDLREVRTYIGARGTGPLRRSRRERSDSNG